MIGFLRSWSNDHRGGVNLEWVISKLVRIAAIAMVSLKFGGAVIVV